MCIFNQNPLVKHWTTCPLPIWQTIYSLNANLTLITYWLWLLWMSIRFQQAFQTCRETRDLQRRTKISVTTSLVCVYGNTRATIHVGWGQITWNCMWTWMMWRYFTSMWNVFVYIIVDCSPNLWLSSRLLWFKFIATKSAVFSKVAHGWKTLITWKEYSISILSCWIWSNFLLSSVMINQRFIIYIIIHFYYLTTFSSLRKIYI